MVRWVTDSIARRRDMNEAQKMRIESVGVLAASGLIAGEALMGLVTATFNFFDIKIPEIFKQPSYIAGLAVLALLAITLIQVPLSNAGRPEDPPPPAVIV
jgi:threonine/homoserine/homoserine lactone efflux protein